MLLGRFWLWSDMSLSVGKLVCRDVELANRFVAFKAGFENDVMEIVRV